MHLQIANMDRVPDEIWILILEHLDVPDLETCSQINKRFRRLCLDKQLIRHRLLAVANWLDKAYPLRPTSAELYDRHILLSKSMLSPLPWDNFLDLTVRLSRTLRRDALRKQLERRPSRQDLVERSIIPKPYLKYDPGIAQRLLDLERRRVVDRVEVVLASRPTTKTAPAKPPTI